MRYTVDEQIETTLVKMLRSEFNKNEKSSKWGRTSRSRDVPSVEVNKKEGNRRKYEQNRSTVEIDKIK